MTKCNKARLQQKHLLILCFSAQNNFQSELSVTINKKEKVDRRVGTNAVITNVGMWKVLKSRGLCLSNK